MIKKYWIQNPTSITRSIITKIILKNNLGNLVLLIKLLNKI